MSHSSILSERLLPADAADRGLLHNEVHARPPAHIPVPILLVYVAVFNDGVSRAQEFAHLQQLLGQSALTQIAPQGNFLRLEMPGYTVQWERHSEFTRYTIVQPLPGEAGLQAKNPDLSAALATPSGWLQGIPGRTIAAIKLAMVVGDMDALDTTLVQARQWLGEHAAVASVIGSNGSALALTDFVLRPSGFERMLVVAPADVTPTRAGRMAQRLLELETYRLMALRGLPVAKELAPLLTQAENELADITAHLEGNASSDQELLDTLVALAARIERATATHMYRFSATNAYAALVAQRISELRERTIPGTQTIGEFMQRRLSPAMATVEATAQRLTSLSERVSRTSALLRTRVDIATEVQNQELLAQLTRGQEMQLRLQSTVEGLSIAAISYYVVSLLLYGGKALKAAGVPVNPEVAAGALMPLVLWSVWRATRRIHQKIVGDHR
jgi:uncharacterized membrane-anchored protein